MYKVVLGEQVFKERINHVRNNSRYRCREEEVGRMSHDEWKDVGEEVHQ
jgi:hypothetical protein